MIPRGRTSPPGSATATAMVSAWTSSPTLRKFVDIDRLLSHVALRGSVAPDRVTYALRSRAGHSIWTSSSGAARHVVLIRWRARDMGHNGSMPEGQVVRESFTPATTAIDRGGIDRWPT